MTARLVSLVACLGMCLAFAPTGHTTRGGPPTAGIPVALRRTTLPTPSEFDHIARTDPVAALEAGLLRYRRQVRGYTCRLAKHERIDGQMTDPATMNVSFRERPFAVRINWLTGGHSLVRSTLYARGVNNDLVTVQLKGAFGVYPQKDYPVNHPKLRAQARYPLSEFGIANGMARTLRTWSGLARAGRLRVQFLGLRKVPAVGNRACYVWRRTDRPAHSSTVSEATICIDAATWLQVSTELKTPAGLLARYHFAGLRLNPQFKPGHFTAAALR